MLVAVTHFFCNFATNIAFLFIYIMYVDMKKIFSLFCLVMIVVACSSDKKKIVAYIENNVADHEMEIVGDVVLDSVFCPIEQLDKASNILIGHQNNLLLLLEVNPDSAFSFANNLKTSLSKKDAFVNMAYPKGKKNRLAYMVKCNVDGRERMVSFFKGLNDDNIEMTSLDLDDAVDSLMVNYDHLMNGINVILEGQNIQ